MKKPQHALLCLLLLTVPSAYVDSVPSDHAEAEGLSQSANGATDGAKDGATDGAMGESVGEDRGVEARSGVEGRVVESNDPMDQVTIYAYEVASNDLVKVTTDTLGRFLFESLPAGMYKLVAFKPGFRPAVELLLRRRPDDHQFVELELQSRDLKTEEATPASDFWTVRGRVPMDVLRQIDDIELQQQAVADLGVSIDNATVFEAEMHAFSGVESLGPSFGEAQLTAAELGVRAAVGGMGVGIDGMFRQLTPTDSETSVDGMVKSVALQLDATADQQLRFATSNSHLVTEQADPVDLDRYQVDWAGRTGSQSSARVSASFVQESNFFSGSVLQPMSAVGDSQTWGLEGAYSSRLTDRTSLEAGLVYQQRSLSGFDTPEESLGLFTSAGSQLQPKVFVEYGLYSSIRDGSLSLVPHGGVVVQFGDKWSAETSISMRVDQEEDDYYYRGYQSSFFGDKGSCREVGEACYEVTFERTDGEDTLAIGAIHREFSETLRLYFSPDFFDRFESVFMVKGDQLPEVQLSLVRRISPKVLARLESNFASGGGGIFYATNESSYENEVRYLVTSLDTRFQQTSTGVFVAFHHLEQAFNPLQLDSESPVKLELQRLQLMLTQDLNVLADLASKWAVNLNMELSRGATPYALTADDQTYRKLTGGFSVSF